MSNILVSVCCITYNHEKFIKNALDGFLMQRTNFDFEILINDDCSPDNTPGVLRDYEKLYPGRFNIIYQSENQHSKGVKILSQILGPKVQGKYIALCEGDDYWTDPYKLQKQVDFLEANKDYSFCFHKCIMVDENNNELINWYRHLEEKDYTGEEVLEKWSVPTASVMFRAKYLDQIIERVTQHKYKYGDYPMWLTLIENGKSRCLGDTMSAYRMHAGGISRITNKKQVITAYQHYKKLKKDFNGRYSKILDMQIGKLTFDSGKSYIKTGKLTDGIKFIVISLFHDKKQLFSAISNKISKTVKKKAP